MLSTFRSKSKRLIVNNFLTLISLISFLSYAHPKDIKTIRVGIDREYAPFEFVDTNGEIRGLSPDILRNIFADTTIELQFIPLTWPEAVSSLVNGKVDIISMIRTPERINKYAFSIAYTRLDQALFTYKNKIKAESINDLTNETIAFQEADICLEKLSSNTTINKMVVKSKNDGFLLLNSGEIDGFFAATQPGIHITKNHNLDDITVIIDNLFNQNMCFAALPDNLEIIQLINHKLSAFINSSAHESLEKKWIIAPHNLIQKYQKLILTGLVVIIGLLLVVSLWVYLLRKQVNSKTEQFIREHELRQLSEKRYSLITENSIDYIFIINPDLSIDYVNRAAAKKIGLDPGKVAGLKIGTIFTGSLGDRLQNNLSSIFQEGIVKSVIGDFSNNEDQNWQHTILIPIKNENAVTTQVIGISRDITDQKLLENELRNLNSLKNLLLDIIVHDIKNPVNSIQGFAELLEEELQDNTYLNFMISAIQKLNDTLNAITFLGQFKTGDVMTNSPLNLHELLQDIISNFTRDLKKKNVKAVNNIDKKIVITANPIIAGVFSNFIGNAITFSEEKSQILIKSATHEKTTKVMICDTAPTIDQADYIDIFKRKYKTSESAGYGLGLSIAKRIVDMHGARLGIEPNKPRGNIFYIEFTKDTD